MNRKATSAEIYILSSNIHTFVLRSVVQTQISSPSDTNSAHKRNLELQRHQSKIDDLNRGPENVVCAQCRQIDILHLLDQMLLSAPLCHSHEGEKPSQTAWSEQQLIHRYSLQGWDGASCGRDRKPLAQSAVPPELKRRHEEAVGHEAGEALEIEGGRSGVRRREGWGETGRLLIEVFKLDAGGDEGVGVGGLVGGEGELPGLVCGDELSG